MNAEELLKKLDAERDAYLATFQQIHEALAKSIIAANTSTPTSTSTPSSGTVTAEQQPQTLSPSSRSGTDRVTRLSFSESERKPPTSTLGGPSTYKSSLISGEDEDLSDDDEALYVQDFLPETSFDDEQLRDHLRKYKFNDWSKALLQPVISSSGRLKDPDHLFPSQDFEGSKYSLYQIFDIGTDGAPLLLHADVVARKGKKEEAMWGFIRQINNDSIKQRRAVGRITVLREPSPHAFGAIHLTMNGLFDMDEIFKELVQQGTTTVCPPRAFSEDPRKQKTFVFSFEYFTIIGDACEPMTWQQTDRERNRPPSHIPISRCSSVVALALSGEPIRKIKNSARRAKTQYGYAYSPWSPWHVLNIQCYPDWKSSTDSHESSKHYVNGPEAFLHTLLAEYRDAQHRFEQISQRVTKLITPPADFIFNSELRDKLLFEDKDFTYSRRYFWAFQVLGTMNLSIKAMIDAYEDTFTDDVWEGRHKTLWPLTDDNSARNTYFKKRMMALKKDFKTEIDALEEIIKENEDRRKEIRMLRDNLFSGTSVLESRKSVEQTEITVAQGQNIKLLTLVNMVFLPLSFSTEIFGMQEIPQDDGLWRFGVVLVAICVPFFLLIGSMNTNSGMRFWREQVGQYFIKIGKVLWPEKKAPPQPRSRSNSNASDNGSEIPMKLHTRSMTAMEGIAERTRGFTSAEKVSESDPPSIGGTRTVSFAKAPSKSKDANEPAHLTDLLRRESRLQAISPLPSPVYPPPPALTAPPSIAKSTGDLTEASDTQSSRVLSRPSGGLWGRLRSSRRYSGGQEDHV